MQSDRHERITERAHQIWLAEGRVHGRHIEHWQRAEREIAEEEVRAAAALAGRAVGAAHEPPRPETTRRRPAATAAGAKAAGAKKPGTAASGKSPETPAGAARRGGRRKPTGPSS